MANNKIMDDVSFVVDEVCNVVGIDEVVGTMSNNKGIKTIIGLCDAKSGMEKYELMTQIFEDDGLYKIITETVSGKVEDNVFEKNMKKNNNY